MLKYVVSQQQSLQNIILIIWIYISLHFTLQYCAFVDMWSHQSSMGVIWSNFSWAWEANKNCFQIPRMFDKQFGQEKHSSVTHKTLDLIELDTFSTMLFSHWYRSIAESSTLYDSRLRFAFLTWSMVYSFWSGRWSM